MRTFNDMRLTILLLAAAAVLPSRSIAQVPVFEITPIESKIRFDVKASVALTGVFDKWDASLRFTSADVETGVLEVKIQAGSVNAGSGMKEGKLKGKDFFDAEHSPLITFVSKKIVPTGPDQYRLEGDFTIRGVSKPEILMLTIVREGDGVGRIQGQMAFDRKDYGMTKNIPFMKIADRVQVDVSLKARRISGPPVTVKIKSGD
jgi:polyisoprenoid-binding protein YceI